MLKQYCSNTKVKVSQELQSRLQSKVESRIIVAAEVIQSRSAGGRAKALQVAMQGKDGQLGISTGDASALSSSTF